MACPKKGAFRTPRYVGPDPLLRQVLAPLAQFPPWPNLLPWSPGGGGVGAGGPDLPATNPPWAPGDGFRPGDDVPVICVPNSSGGCDYWPITPNRPGCDCSNCVSTGSTTTCSHFSETPSDYKFTSSTTAGSSTLAYVSGCIWRTAEAFSFGAESAKATLTIGGTGIQDVTLVHGGKTWKNVWDWCPLCNNEMRLVCSGVGQGSGSAEGGVGSSDATDAPCVLCIAPMEGGSGDETLIDNVCCDNIPQVLRVTFTGGTGGCDCFDDFFYDLTYDPANGNWIASGIDYSVCYPPDDKATSVLDCDDVVPEAWNFALTDSKLAFSESLPTSQSCTPFSLVYEDLSIGDDGSCGVTGGLVTVTISEPP